MNKILLAAAASTLAALTACGPGSTGSATKDLSDGVPNRSGASSTGVGNRTELFLYRDGSQPPLLYVWYYDTQRYFGEYGNLAGVLKVENNGKSVTRRITLGTYGGDGEGQVTSTHIAQVRLEKQDAVDTIELAFSNTAGTKWDSDEGRNYRIKLK